MSWGQSCHFDKRRRRRRAYRRALTSKKCQHAQKNPSELHLQLIARQSIQLSEPARFKSDFNVCSRGYRLNLQGGALGLTLRVIAVSVAGSVSQGPSCCLGTRLVKSCTPKGCTLSVRCSSIWRKITRIEESQVSTKKVYSAFVAVTQRSRH